MLLLWNAYAPPAIDHPRSSKLIFAFRIDEDGNVRKDMDDYLRREKQLEDELEEIAALWLGTKNELT